MPPSENPWLEVLPQPQHRSTGGICGDLAKIYDRYKFVEAEPCNITIQDDEDLDLVFKQLLKSEKLSYICSRLMNETSWLGYLRTYQSGTTNLPIAAPAIYLCCSLLWVGTKHEP